MKNKSAGLDLKRCTVFFDFDNTLTSFDVLDDIIARFAINNRWIKFEKLWQKGKISSHKCLKEQMRLVKIDRKGLLKHISRVKIDPYFKILLSKFKSRGASLAVLSDSFSFIIRNILRKNRIKGIRVYSNRLRFSPKGFVLSFPHRDRICGLCAHCKKNHLLRHSVNGKILIYIGDGNSDICPALHADMVFAKGRLREEMRRRKKHCIAIESLKDVHSYFRRHKIC